MQLSLLLLACAAPSPGETSSDSLPSPPSDQEDSAHPPAEIQLSSESSWRSEETGESAGSLWLDVSGDGQPQLALSYGGASHLGPISLYQPSGGERAAVQETSEHRHHGRLCAGDLDQDGWIDLVSTLILGEQGTPEGGGALWYRNQGGHFLDPPDQQWELGSSQDCALADLDQDGDLDLALAIGDADRMEPEVSVVLENVGGELSPQPLWESPAGHHVAAVAADLSGDGLADLALAESIGRISIYPGSGGGLEAQPRQQWEAPGTLLSMVSADWSGDGQPDLMAAGSAGDQGWIAQWCGPDWSLCWSMELAWIPVALLAADLDQDGDEDLVVASDSGRVQAHRQLSSGLESEPNWEGRRSPGARDLTWEPSQGLVVASRDYWEGSPLYAR